jgi:hypothetical protein
VGQESTNAATSNQSKAVFIAPDTVLDYSTTGLGRLVDYRVEKIKVELSIIPISLILKIIIKLQVIE